MEYRINIPYADHCYYCHTLLGYSDYQHISHEGIVEMYIWKVHNHRYKLECFFYKSKRLYTWHFFKTKKELYDCIQKLLQEELYGAIQ